MSDEPVKTCPKCKKKKVQRLITGGNFILKGGGWYADLYHKPAVAKKSESEGSSSSSSSETKSETKSEAKSETKAEPKSEAKSESKPKKKKD